MKLQFYIPENETLRKYIEGYYFIADDESEEVEEYFTFPNNYAIVSINSDSNVTFSENQISIVPSAKKNIYASLIYNYTTPITIHYERPIREITIYFKPLGINRFVDNLETMFSSMQPVEFVSHFDDFEVEMKRIFNITDRQLQRNKLEAYWMSKFTVKDLSKIEDIIVDLESNMKIADIAQKNNISRKHLYKMVYKYLGKSPMDYRKIFRFRNAIDNKGEVRNLTELSYKNEFYDQPHFVKDFKALTKSSPNSFFKNVDIEIKNIWRFI
ncbi:helix-turn-helix domain-containing protein [Sphingobacterium sp.]|uniref:helix-turn-helix domain-containing protein n=1 Tax=Sphingobacterium sp. TaxID=341027 RepID=UPI00289E6DC9|nr:helix-turn-helix domain-containing protein [Sphingobacterium sp.]